MRTSLPLADADGALERVALMVVVPMPEKAHHSMLRQSGARTVPAARCPTMWRRKTSAPVRIIKSSSDLGIQPSGPRPAVVKHLHLVPGTRRVLLRGPAATVGHHRLEPGRCPARWRRAGRTGARSWIARPRLSRFLVNTPATCCSDFNAGPICAWLSATMPEAPFQRRRRRGGVRRSTAGGCSGSRRAAARRRRPTSGELLVAVRDLSTSSRSRERRWTYTGQLGDVAESLLRPVSAVQNPAVPENARHRPATRRPGRYSTPSTGCSRRENASMTVVGATVSRNRFSLTELAACEPRDQTEALLTEQRLDLDRRLV